MQKKLHSLIESGLNTLSGFGISILVQLAIFPLFKIEVTIVENIYITIIFTIVSLVRSYCVRRIFNGLHSCSLKKQQEGEQC